MFREFVILLCAGTFVSGIAVQSTNQNASAQSQARTSVAGQQQDHLTVPSQISYQKTGAPSSKYSPTYAPSYQVNSAIVDTISETAQVKNVPGQSYGQPNAQQPIVTVSASVAADPSSPEYNNILERYAPPVRAIRPYFSAPLAAKIVTIGSMGAANGHSQASQGQNVQPFVLYTSNTGQSGSYYAVPVGQKVAQPQRFVNTQAPSSQGTKGNAPGVVYAATSAPRPFYPASTAIFESHGEFRVQSPAEATYQVGQVQAVNTQQPQYISAPKVAYNGNPVVKTVSVPLPVAKKVSIESYNSVMTHPPPAPKYAPVQIPVPVIVQQVGTQYPATQQFAVLTNTVAPTAGTYVQAPVSGQAIPVPVYTTGARLQYHHVPVAGAHQQGYAKAVSFSPASEVSRVIFNGLGVSYGW